MADRCDVLVIGAGVVGISTAYALARRGLSVTVLDRAEEPARGASFANGAQLSYAYTDALASPRLFRDLPRLILAADPAFRLRPSLDPAFLSWGLSFLRNCTASRFRTNTLAGLRLGLESRAALHALLERHPLDFGHVVAGKLHLLESRIALRSARTLVELKRRAGVEQQVVSPVEAAQIEPAIAHRAPGLSGAVWSPQEEVGDPYLFCAQLLRILTSDYGVTSRFGLAVDRLEARGDGATAILASGERVEAGQLAVCAGIESPALLAGLGIRSRIWPMKGYSVTAAPGDEAPKVSITDMARRLVFCRLSGNIRIAGLADLGSRDTKIHGGRLQTFLKAARASLPRAADYGRIRAAWAGLRPMTPNSLPIISRAGRNVVLNVGHGTLGWTFAMGAAERTAALVAGESA